ncbi:hypothetical protein QFC19_004616 [Naganishia cerealis]|uniref:Uncharacterized protein n=1 Tax=Naganishia cerealis TaxID=610337 RepID=A0ACC2VVS7_9TREE|nr:hypothetical protein QFC19_004616 [Naganishia cerealis]
MPNLGYTTSFAFVENRKFNARENDPNPLHIMVAPHAHPLTRLPGTQKATAIMKAVAAQMKRIMEKRKLVVNSFEEVLAGRNWNHGEVIELVLRRPSGSFLPLWYVLNVMCHEVRFYSSGIHLASSIIVEGGVINAGDAPEYICGGAANRQAPSRKTRTGQAARGRKRVLQNGIASSSSGAQTAKKRKAGSSNAKVFEGREEAVRIDGAQEISKDELKRVKALVNERKAVFRTSLGLTIKAATEKALQSLTPSERRLIETSTHGKRYVQRFFDDSARDARAAHFERLLATKTEQDKPISNDKEPKTAVVKGADSAEEDDASNNFDSAPDDDEENLEEYAQDFMGKMDEDERKVAKGDDVHFFESGVSSVPSHTSTVAIDRTEEGRGKSVISQPYVDNSQRPTQQRSLASGLPSTSRTKTSTTRFDKDMIDDERRRARADLLGMRHGGQTIRRAPLGAADKGDTSQDDVIVIED